MGLVVHIGLDRFIWGHIVCHRAYLGMIRGYMRLIS